MNRVLSAYIEREMPTLLAGTSVVALVPATDLRGWAAEMAWRVARAAAATGRRTVLVDCFVNAPTLHGVAGDRNDEGLVDAFEYGASLNRIVQQQPQADLFFIPAGTYTSDAEPVMQHPRWRRLSAGFRHEDALLLLYVAADHLTTLAAEPDGVVVLAPQGEDLAVADHPALADAVARGLPLLAVVADEDSVTRASGAHQAPSEPAPAAEAAEAARAPIFRVGAEPAPSRRGPLVAAVLVLLVAAALWLAWRGGALERLLPPRTRSDPGPPADSGRMAVAPAAAAPAPQPAARVPVDTLPWAVQVSALPRLADALAMADSFEAHGTHTMVAPIRLPGRGAFFRVHAGPWTTRTLADSALTALRAGGFIARGTGSVVYVPLSVPLGDRPSRSTAETERSRLREQGVPTFILGLGDGTFRLFAGAYSASAQASLLQDLLTPTGGAGALVPRTGTVP